MLDIPNNRKISGYNFARISDVIFSEGVTDDQFNLLNKKQIKVLSNTENFSYYKSTDLTLKSNDIVYTNPVDVNLLFKYLEKLNNVKNIILITSQTDIPITKKLFEKKPDVVSKWFSTNIDYIHQDLIPIPLGVANDYSSKNLKVKDFDKQSDNLIKIEKLYINVQKNTNTSARGNLDKIFKNFNWVVIDEPNLKLDEYLIKLGKYKFVLCPRGNGIDTHRIWETLYAGSIPVVQNHITHSSFQNLPIIFFDDYRQITFDFLQKNYEDIKEKNYEELDINYWKTQINFIKDSINTNEEFISSNNFFEFYFFNKRKIIGNLNKFRKKVMYFYRRLSSLIIRKNFLK